MQRSQITPDYSISKVEKGGWQISTGHSLDDGFDPNQAVDDIMTFYEAGITTFDFGDIYLGVEETIGQFLAQLRERYGEEARNNIQLHTKYVPDRNLLPSHSPEDVRQIIDRSRERLGVETLDLVQFHWWDYEVPGYLEAMKELYRLRDEGLIRFVGITNFDTKRLNEMIDAEVKPRFIQLQYSLLDRRPENEILELCRNEDIDVLCYGTVAGGYLSDKFLGMENPPPFETRSQVKYRLIIEEFGGWDLYQELLHCLRVIADKNQTDIASVASAYALREPAVKAVIVGARNTNHLDENISIPEVNFDSIDLAAIQAILDRSQGPNGPVYDLERYDPRHRDIMHTNNNASS